MHTAASSHGKAPFELAPERAATLRSRTKFSTDQSAKTWVHTLGLSLGLVRQSVKCDRGVLMSRDRNV